MFRLFRRKRTASYTQEAIDVQMRIMRSHLAGVSSQMSTLTTLAEGIRQHQLDTLDPVESRHHLADFTGPDVRFPVDHGDCTSGVGQ